jgi:hypothetical protein
VKKPDDQERGWKPDPKDEGQVRYWNGITWTQSLRPKPGPGTDLASLELPAVQADPQADDAVSQPVDSIVRAGWWTSMLIPVVGFFVGMAVLIRGDVTGVWIMLTSVVMFFIWLQLWVFLAV